MRANFHQLDGRGRRPDFVLSGWRSLADSCGPATPLYDTLYTLDQVILPALEFRTPRRVDNRSVAAEPRVMAAPQGFGGSAR